MKIENFKIWVLKFNINQKFNHFLSFYINNKDFFNNYKLSKEEREFLNEIKKLNEYKHIKLIFKDEKLILSFFIFLFNSFKNKECIDILDLLMMKKIEKKEVCLYNFLMNKKFIIKLKD